MDRAQPRPLSVPWRTIFIAALAIPNAFMLHEAFSLLLTRDYTFDWWLIEEAWARLGTGTMYEWGAAGQLGDEYLYRYSPLMAFVAPLGLSVWRLLHFAALLLLPRWLALLVLLAGPFWLDVAHGNVLTFALVFAWLALAGNRWAAVAYTALALLVPRPLMLPVLAWMAWKRPEWRVMLVGTAAIVLAATLATGEGPGFARALTRSSDLIAAFDHNVGPSRIIGGWWVPIGLMLGTWLAMRGRLGLASLAISPYVIPYYLLALLWELAPLVRRTGGVGHPEEPDVRQPARPIGYETRDLDAVGQRMQRVALRGEAGEPAGVSDR